MEATRVLRDIKKKKILPIYLLWGEEEYLKKKIIVELKNCLVEPEMSSFNLDFFEGGNHSLKEILSRAETPPVLSNKRLIIVKNPPYFSEEVKEKKELEDLVRYLQEPVSHTCLVFSATKIDKRKKITRLLVKSNGAADCSPVKEGELKKWVRQKFRQEGKNIDNNALENLIELAGNDLNRLENEINKLCTYLGEDNNLSREKVKGLVTGSLESGIFSLVDSLGNKNKKEALDQLHRIILQGEPPLKILTMIARQFRLLIQVKTLQEGGYTRQEMIKELKVHPFVVKKLLSQVENFTRKELKRGLIKSHETDLKIKTGQLEPHTSLEFLIAGLE
ncbi:MAG: DNA polymerase III subunit delta [Candidatus Syntrophonatronum acetioxidans]|uniref:DNA polymerase III subunit delta n=1 Tax=Candidatus Syntrophonatronum acetioxidans TaxID=1795816 RepID=A0A424Y983_9FIRM|nr:MAG: DNA polymerase III subunit delta [Candidatus Syntrophonatronum acetioxidans]